ncbi:hypothetical protein B0J14DRAFT_570596 [Halenospora varia]|nr:hypothetical protein B0J14DRAFT_570596 [Halenospora varia]
MQSQLSSSLLYTAAGLSALTVAAHTQMGLDLVLPSLKKTNPTDPGLKAAKIGWMELNQGYVLMSAPSPTPFSPYTPVFTPPTPPFPPSPPILPQNFQNVKL